MLPVLALDYAPACPLPWTLLVGAVRLIFRQGAKPCQRLAAGRRISERWAGARPLCKTFCKTLNCCGLADACGVWLRVVGGLLAGEGMERRPVFVIGE